MVRSKKKSRRLDFTKKTKQTAESTLTVRDVLVPGIQRKQPTRQRIQKLLRTVHHLCIIHKQLTLLYQEKKTVPTQRSKG